MPFYRKSLLILWEATKMNDNVIAYILSLVCIIFILIEIVSVNKKKGMTDLIVFFYYSCPLYYFMLYRGYGGAAFTWWFYLLLLTFIHLVILAFRFAKIIVAKRIRRRNKSNKNGELPFLWCNFVKHNCWIYDKKETLQKINAKNIPYKINNRKCLLLNLCCHYLICSYFCTNFDTNAKTLRKSMQSRNHWQWIIIDPQVHYKLLSLWVQCRRWNLYREFFNWSWQ